MKNFFTKLFGNPIEELNSITQGANISDVKPKPQKTTLSPNQKRLLRHFAQGNTLSINNSGELKITNIARDVKRYVEFPFGIELSRKRFDWKDDFGNGHYTVYSATLKDLPTIHQLCRENNIIY